MPSDDTDTDNDMCPVDISVTTSGRVTTVDVRSRGGSPMILERELATALDSVATGNEIRLWMHEVDGPAAKATADIDQLAASLGFERWRDLWQMRCVLPTERTDLRTRAFTTDDLDEFVRVNNRAFSWHPEQGQLTVDSVAATMNEPWFNPDGFRLLHEDEDLIGFCWTKIHRDLNEPLGEIYAIAIDPSAHGRGLGVPMTKAGLDWLGDQGLTTGMLYVESDNDAAVATYHRIGFVHHHTDRAWRR